MAFKFVVLAALAAVASAGLLPASYSSAPAVSYSSVSTPLVAAHGAPALSYSAPALSYAAPAVSYSAPAVSYSAPALSYAAPSYKVAAPALSYAAPAYKVAAPVSHAVLAEPSAPAQYDFGYSVNDPHTGDNKSQQESRHGDAVQGSYSLIEADGSKRTVEYTADAHNGFNAVVHNEPAAVHVKAVAPLAHGYAAPLAHAAPAYYH